MVYDITKRNTFEKAEKWLSDLREAGNPFMSIVLVGNKSDLELKREVSKEDANKFAAERGITCIETSAETGENVEKVRFSLV
ncbi:MAG: GTP-binding protein [Candidatus Pacebacteria bacterium]|nr:GTP-binding protein [Candidatus Paceibacterota bacterium]